MRSSAKTSRRACKRIQSFDLFTEEPSVLHRLWRTSKQSPAEPYSVLVQQLRQQFAVYRVDRLHGISAGDFQRELESRIGAVDADLEGYANEETDRQRDLSIKFFWGHDHDFGSFKLEGRMAERHLKLLANFCTLFSRTPESFAGKDVFDIGCWTGGTSLLLAALGSRVHAIEEVRKYADTASFLAKSFGIEERVHVEALSLYGCNAPAFYDRFDIAYFPGVIYHLSDPLIGLRIIFNSLKSGGDIFIESAGIDHEMPYCRFDGSLVHTGGTRERLDRGGWNWFMPSPSALARMMSEAGFEQIEAVWHEPAGRVYAYAKKVSQVGICRAGLSAPTIR